jgi:hypothetical protein
MKIRAAPRTGAHVGPSRAIEGARLQTSEPLDRFNSSRVEPEV